LTEANLPGRNSSLLAAKSGRTTQCRTNEGEQAGKAMTSTRRFKRSIAATMLAGLVLSTAAFAQTPSSDPYGPAGPPPDMQQGSPQNQPGQYGQQPQQGYADQQNGGPTAQQQAAATITNVPQEPPPIPDYEQPEAPGDGYIWTPGYWAWTGDGYEWVQGAWVEPPYVSALWTPGFWGSGYGGYAWYPGYWGPYVGYYGGLNYGFGYFGIGFYGGYWGGGRFWYNRAYCNIGRGYGFHTYNRTYAGYSGRPGGNSFVHSTSIANRGAGSSVGFRGSSINGRTSSFAQGASRSNYTGSAYSGGARSYTGAGNYNGGTRNFAQPSQSYNGGARSYAQPSQSYSGGGARSYSAPSGGNYGGGMSSGGGGFHGGGGGGGSHGGGGGHR
jgi:WXXGXW repeat (2 copies)